MSLLGAAVGAGLSLFGGSKSGKKFKFRGGSVTGPTGGATIDKKGRLSVTEDPFSGGARSFFQGAFQNFAADPVGAQAAGGEFSRTALGLFGPQFDATQALGFDRTAGQTQQFLGDTSAIAGLFGGIGQEGIGRAFGAASGQPLINTAAGAAAGFLGDTDLSALAAQRTAQLNQLAGPSEQRAVNSTLQGLFNTGRLGTAGGAQVLGQLSQAQEQAATQRALAGVDLADRLRGQNIAAGSNLLGLGLQGVGQEQLHARGLGGIGQNLLTQVPGIAGAQLGAVFGLDQAQVGRGQERLQNLINLFNFGTAAREQPVSLAARALSPLQIFDNNFMNLANTALGIANARSGVSGGSGVGTALQGLGTGIFNRSIENGLNFNFLGGGG